MARMLRRMVVLMIALALPTVMAFADDAQCKVTRNNALNYENNAYGLLLYLGEDDGRAVVAGNGYSMWDYNNFATVYIDGKLACNIMDLMCQSDLLKSSSTNLKKNALDQLQVYRNNMHKWIASCETENGDVVSIGHIEQNNNDNEFWLHVEFMFRNDYVGKKHEVMIMGKWINNGGTASSKSFTYTTEATNAGYMPTQDKGKLTLNPNGTITYTLTGSSLTPVGLWAKKTTYENLWLYEGSDHLEDANHGRLSEKGCIVTNRRKMESHVANDMSTTCAIDYSKPHEIYTRYFRTVGNYTNEDYNWQNKLSNSTNFIVDFPKSMIIPCMPVPTNLNGEFDAWNKKVKLTWNSSIANTEDGKYDNDGNWAILRKDANGNIELVGMVAHKKSVSTTDKYSFEDGEFLYDKRYTYFVSYAHKDWGEISAPVKNLNASVEVNTERQFEIKEFNVEGLENSVKVSWKINELKDASSNKSYNLYIKRKKEGEADWSIIHTEKINNSRTLSGHFEDKSTDENGIKPCEQALYGMEIDVMEKTFSKGLTNSDRYPAAVTGTTRVTSVTTTHGEHSGMVRINWNAKIVGTTPATFELQRRKLGTDGEWRTIYAVEGTAKSYSYDDVTAKPGDYYEYRVICTVVCGTDGNGNPKETSNSLETDGFALASGTVNGRIYYESGTAVDGVKVMLVPNGESDESLFRSMRTGSSGEESYISWYPENGQAGLETIIGQDKPWSLQLMVKPAVVTEGKSGVLAKIGKGLELGVEEHQTEEEAYCTPYIKYISESGESYTENIDDNDMHLAAGNWYGITLAANTAKSAFTLMITDENDNFVKKEFTYGDKAAAQYYRMEGGLAIGDQEASAFNGWFDEVRLFTRELSEADVKRNSCHPLSGTEKGLALYWTFDEGINGQSYAYDYSSTDGVRNNRHGIITDMRSSSDVPSEEMFSLCSFTDQDGNYTITGVPFSGDGRSYSIVPSLGIHKFNPASVSRMVSVNSMVHNAVDFKDISSFKVSGTIWYENTNVPVKEAMIYVDGTPASKDGESVKTDENGEFVVDVPIGDHFVSAKLQGHTFVDGGRFPVDKDEVGTRYTFTKEISGLRFFDNTLLTVAGRVVGGKIEGDKPIGFGSSEANIGAAEIRLSIANDNYKHYLNVKEVKDEASVSYDPSDTELTLQQGSSYVNSSAKVGAKQGSNPDECKYITIHTDSENGEFAVKLPPLLYKVESVKTKSYDLSDCTFSDIDATNANLTQTDSLEIKKSLESFDYNVKWVYAHKATPVLHVEQVRNSEEPDMDVNDDNPWDGHFGDSVFKGIEINTKGEEKEFEVKLYDIDPDTKAVKYQYGKPIFTQLARYKFHIQEYEEYFNKDADMTAKLTDETKWVRSIVPVAGDSLSIKNELATTAVVDSITYEYLTSLDNGKLGLDENGEADYVFQAGFPYLVGDHSRAFSISYDGDAQQWNGFTKGIVLGNIPKGNNFVTEAPDKVTMILRHPGGSSSSATWTEGTTKTTFYSQDRRFYNKDGTKFIIRAGLNTKALAGGAVGGIIIETNYVANKLGGVNIEGTVGTKQTETVTTTVTDAITTKNENWYVGNMGDIFVGSSANTIIGEAADVTIKKQLDGTYKLVTEDVMTMSTEFKTSFVYTQYHIINVLIPQLEKLRNDLIEPETNDTTTRHMNKYRYVSKVPNDHPDFGKKEYVTIVDPSPLSTETVRNEVENYNNQIDTWIKHLKENELAKINAIENHQDKVKNYSFDGGTSYTHTYSKSKTNTDAVVGSLKVTVFGGFTAGHQNNGSGFINETIIEGGSQNAWEDGDGKTDASTFSYTLAESGLDYLSVDVYEDTEDKFGPIFVTRGGVTSCPYEDEYRPRFVDKDIVLSAKTVKGEDPQIEIENPIITGVPSGQSGILKLKLTNISPLKDITTFTLGFVQPSNKDGLQLFVDGAPVQGGISIALTPNVAVTKTVEVKQIDPDVLEYKDITLRFSSTCAPKTTFDTASFNISFLPSGASIKLGSSVDRVNSNTKDDLKLYLSDYNINSNTLDRIELQYRMGNGSWTTLKTFVKEGDERLNDGSDNYAKLMTLGSSEETKHLAFKVPLQDSNKYSDGIYEFRAQTVCLAGNEGTEIRNESEIITIVRDVHSPQPLGNPTPSNGVLGVGDDVSITFNEDILKENIVKGTNIVVTGVLNDSKLDHDVAAAFSSAGGVARTQSAIDLSQRSFTIGAWIYCDGAGTLLTHGSADNKLTLALTADKHLSANIGGKEGLSEDAVPLQKWIYVTMAYSNDGSDLTLHYAYDSTEKSFIINNVEEYFGNGSLSLGGFTGRMHELTLWNRAMTWSEMKVGMDVTKNRYTPDLIGYWPLNEGHGAVAEDFSRNRNMTLPGTNAWAMATENFHAETDSEHFLIIPVMESLHNDESYVIEEWFRADENSNDSEATLLAFSNGKFSIELNAQGNMVLGLENASKTISSKNWRDGQWHHLAVATRLSTTGVSSILVDGNTIHQLPAASTPAFQTDFLWAGGAKEDENNVKTLKGGIDEVRVWKGIRTVGAIKQEMYNRIRAVDEPSLKIYYPLEKADLGDSKVLEVQSCTLNQAKDAATSLYDKAIVITTEGSLGMKTAKVMEDVDFNFVANERKIVITPEADPQRMEGCTLTFKTKYIQDGNENYADDVTWTALVQRNKLKWENNSVSLRKQGTVPAVASVTLVNRGNTRQDYVITGMPSWLSLSAEAGSIEALSSKTLDMTIDGGTPVGKYETVLYLMGEDGISEPLYVSLTSAGDVPEWAVNPGNYETSMNIVGRIKIDGNFSTDEEDMLAAFIGTECRGVARPMYVSRDDAYYVMLNIYGNGNEGKKPITYKLYDASTGIVYPTISAGEHSSKVAQFVSDCIVGSVTQPVIWTPLNDVEQNVVMHEGWNWLSLYVRPDHNSVADVFGDNFQRVDLIKDQKSSYEVGWGGDLKAMVETSMYKVKVNDAKDNFVFVGKQIKTEDVAITLKPQWTWIGYPSTTVMSVTEALAGANPLNGDVVKSQTEFSMYDNNAWIGTLSTLNPSQGYLYFSSVKDQTTKLFSYPAPTSADRIAYAKRMKQTADDNADGSGITMQDATGDLGKFENNMSVVAVVKDGDEVVSDAVVKMYGIDGECVSIDASVLDSLHFITIGGNNGGELLRITVQRNNGNELLLTQTMTFQADAIFGTVSKPFVIQMSDADGIYRIHSDGTDDDIYDVSGKRETDSYRGVVIKRGKKYARK